MSEKLNKLKHWAKQKRYYIVLALCILAVSATYMLLSWSPTVRQDAPSSDVVSRDNATANEPLPDLADYFPPELEPDAIEEKRQETQNNADDKTDTQSSIALQASANAPSVEEAPVVYQFPVDGKLQKAYSGNTLVYSETMSDWRAHAGIDLTAEPGSDVFACADGTIEDVYTDARLGITIVINHKNGVKSIYANLSNGMLVEKGQNVRAGEIISTVGNSALFEAAEESHLHFEMLQNSEHIDPLTLLD